MRWVRIAAIGAGVVLLGMQAFQPERNSATGPFTESFERVIAPPDTVVRLLQRSCYDCHSNNTHYPWYTRVQPVGWYLANHVKEGKAELNFHAFGTYSARRQVSKLRAIRESIEEGTMPLSSYTILHNEAKLSDSEKAVLIQWLTKEIDRRED